MKTAGLDLIIHLTSSTEGVVTLSPFLTPVLPRGGGSCQSLADFPCRPKTEKESDLSHLGDLFDILRCHFDGQGTTLHGARVSRQRSVGRG